MQSYKWRHDQVLKEIVKCVEEKIKDQGKHLPEKKICFVKEGEKRKEKTMHIQESYFQGANDWKLQVDLDKSRNKPSRYGFPS